ncbi:beta-lactamase family protein [Luteolibacter pohnpeiensis]|uniref:Beta-lactamase family protein n=1 Tax=Luteolibacter pohnpeiensis TaxID=454153 RepID=A0A934VQK5_9BACT|nr:serine hydrolase domain-containing protein [Luteolibacter pohnpeiensis]MBK1882186.1 beta-lactamase family protein [Luteolibacter pohnpeiensis]
MAVAPSVLGEIAEVFERNFRERGELGASISIWWNGIELLSESAGWCEKEQLRPWDSATMVPVYSATKGPAAATLLVALESAGLNPSSRVREVWSRFPVAEATFAHLLSHQCGLPALDQRASVWDHEAVVAAIEEQEPAWQLGHGHGYHPRTFGALLEEPVRRLTGMPLGEYWRQKIGDPLNLDFWIGLPEKYWPRVAKLYPGKAAKSDLEEGFYREFNQEGTLTRRAFSSPRGLHSVQEMNDPKAWSAGICSMGGIGTASALAKFYQAAIGALESPLSTEVRLALATVQSAAEDRVLLRPTVFTCGCQKDPVGVDGEKIRRLYGKNQAAFGHPGAGGSHGFGDPETGISFAYVMNQMELSVMPGQKCVEMIEALYDGL